MKRTALTNNNFRFWKTVLNLTTATWLFAALISGNSNYARAQAPQFGGAYDSTFAAPRGYYVEPETVDPTIPADVRRSSYFLTGDLNPDGSIIAGGRIEGGDTGDFWLRKFTASGAVDTSFGNGTGYVRTTFYPNQEQPGANEYSLPQVLKRQPDGKILFAGQCKIFFRNFGTDVCLIRYNADGTLDQSFGNNAVRVGSAADSTTFQSGAGKFTMQTGQIDDCNTFASFGLQIYAGTNGIVYDIAVQPDGKIVLAGETTDYIAPFSPGCGATQRTVGILIRLNPNGSLDSSFGANGIARLVGLRAGNVWGPIRFNKVLVQTDGRIVAVGHDGTVDPNAYFGKVFLVTRWTAAGQLETRRRLDNNQSIYASEIAHSALFSRDNTKLLVSGSYQNKQTIARFNLNDLSLDTTFADGGVRQLPDSFGNADSPLSIRAIQPDGKILAVDYASLNGSRVVRLNPNGSPDNSFGNFTFDNTDANPRGRLALSAQTYNGATPLFANHLLLRPDGKINLIGSVPVGFEISRSIVSRQFNVLRNGGIHADFENDGRADFAVFRSGQNVWHNLSSRDNAYSAINWGLSNDKLAPADYDGDGRTDAAVYRSGTWYILQSASNTVRYANFGASEDLPRPGDFDGDGYADISVWRPSNGVWYRLSSGNGQFVAVQWGAAGDAPMLGDYDGDGRTDYAVFRPAEGNWYIFNSADNSVRVAQFGVATDVPVNGDFNGDNRSDLAVYRRAEGRWYVARATGVPAQNFDTVQFGLFDDVPAAADYDDDARADIAVYRSGIWYVSRSRDNQLLTAQFGASGDVPIQSAYLR